jgi:superfamily I DNA and/or RNA helicase
MKDNHRCHTSAPRTGKTKTASELLVALVRSLKKSSIILVCAPSNAACDELLLRVSELASSITLVRVGNQPGDRVQMFTLHQLIATTGKNKQRILEGAKIV